MTENSKKPRIRFKGFTEAWEQRKVLNTFKVTRGYVLAATKTSSTKSYKTPYPVYSSQTKDNGLMGYYSDYLFDTAITWTTDGANAGTVRFRAGKFYCTNVCGVLLSENGYANKMVAEALNLVAWKYVSKVGNPKLMNNVMGEIEILIPNNIEEQTKVSQLFDKIDNLITLHQRKYDKLVAVKKSLLEKMFPQGKETTPKIRFKGFTEAWEQRKLGQIGSVAMCKRVFKEQTQEEGDIPFYKIGTFGGQADAYISYELFEDYKEKYPYPQKGDILISASGSIGRTVVFSGKNEYFQDSNIVWLEHGGKVDNVFLRFFYEVVRWEGIEGSTIKRLYNDNILKTKINLPNRTEQTKIGCFFEQIDNLITLHQRKLEKLKNIKSALLEKMFV